MKGLIEFKNAQIEALQNAIAEQDKTIMQLETFIFELTDKDSPEEYKQVIRKEVFGTNE
jgi:cell division protein FtsB